MRGGGGYLVADALEFTELHQLLLMFIDACGAWMCVRGSATGCVGVSFPPANDSDWHFDVILIFRHLKPH